MPTPPPEPTQGPTPDRSPSLHRSDVRGSSSPRGVVLMLHGGQADGHERVGREACRGSAPG